MAGYRRYRVPGGTYFFTVVTQGRLPILASAESVALLRAAFRYVRATRPFTVIAIVVLPDHIHTLWRLPDGDADFSIRWRLLKHYYSRRAPVAGITRASLRRCRERGLWQRRFWEHLVRDADDLHRHIDYVHYNPVRHGLVHAPREWPYGSFQRYVERGLYPVDWASDATPDRIADLDLE